MAPTKNGSNSKVVRHPVKDVIPGIYTQHKPSECYHMVGGKPIHRKLEKAAEGKETIRIVENDLIREMVVPARKPEDIPGIWNTTEMDRLRQQAHVVTYKDRIAMLEEAEKKKNQLLNESAQRKELLKLAQNKSKKGSHLTQVEIAEQKRTAYLLERARKLQQENDIEVQAANRMILAAKCHAVRDAQLAEKALIEKELREEENRLVKMQEQQNAKAYVAEVKKREVEKAKRRAFVGEVLQQIREHEVEQLFDIERKEEEAKIQNRLLIQMQTEEAEKSRQKKDQQEKMRADLDNANTQLRNFKLIQREEDRIADLRVQEFLRKKAEREKAFEEEKQRVHDAKEKEKERIRELAERGLSLQASGDEMNARRIQEECEREFRRKEKEAAEKRKADTERLKQAREEQIMDIRRQQALEIEKDKDMFNKVLQVQRQSLQKEMEDRSKRAAANNKHRQDLLRQITEKERERINDRQRKFEEGLASKLEEMSHDKEIEECITQKLDVLKTNGISDHLISDIKRQLNLSD